MQRQLIKSILIMVVILVTFIGCGGGGGGSASSENVNDNPSDTVNPVVVTPSSLNLSGTIVDGLIADATVCLDINNNQQCDTSDPTTTSKEDGSFIFTLDNPYQGEYKVISMGGTDTATNQYFDGILKSVITLESNASSLSTLLSPLTTLSSKFYESQKLKDSTFTLKKAQEQLAQKLGLSF